MTVSDNYPGPNLPWNLTHWQTVLLLLSYKEWPFRPVTFNNHGDLMINSDTEQHQQLILAMFENTLYFPFDGWKLLPFEWRGSWKESQDTSWIAPKKISWNENWPSFDNNHIKPWNESEKLKTDCYQQALLVSLHSANFKLNFNLIFKLNSKANVAPPDHWQPVQPFVQKWVNH